MKNIDWSIIFKLKEFGEHLFNHDLILLSMCSKKLRQQLNTKIFKTLNFCPFVSNRNYSRTVIKEESTGMGFKIFHLANPYKPLNSELTESKERFSSDLKMFNQNTKKIILTDSRAYFYLLYEIPNIFSNITTLIINDSAFTIEVLQYVLDSLKYLENLSLTENTIFKDTDISNEYTIDYPISLTSLKLGENGVIMIQDKFSSIAIKRIKQDSSGSYEFNGTYQHLPSLVTFDYDMSYDYPEESGDLFQFIKLNPQLKCLKLSGIVFNYDLFDIIKNLKNLTHLEYRCDYMNEDLENYEMPVLYNISHLHLEIFSDSVDNMMRGKFPNVIELTKEIDTSINYEKDNLIESFPNLKKLKFIFKCRDKDIEDFILPELKCLESLEINLNYEEARLENFKWNVNACEKLKIIAFTKNESCTPFERFELNQELTKHWDILYFPHKITFCKHS